MKKFLVMRSGFNVETEVNPGIRVTGNGSLSVIDGRYDWWDNAHQQLYFMVDKEAHADQLIKEMASRTPGVVWSKYTLCGTAKAKAGPVEMTVVTEQGVLPA